MDNSENQAVPCDQHSLRHFLGEALGGGTDAPAAAILTLLLALSRSPDVQQKARGEIDNICGVQR